MINILSPGKVQDRPPGASFIELEYQKNGTWYYTWDDKIAGMTMSANRFYTNYDNGRLNGVPPSTLKVDRLNYDRLFQRSERTDYLNTFDTTSPLPKLSSGRTENPCHHESIDGTISITPEIPENPNINQLYPCYFDLDSTMHVGSDRSWKSCSQIKGFAMAILTQASWYQPSTGITGYSPYFLTPVYWITSEFTYYKWAKSGPSTLADAQKLGIVSEEKIIKTLSSITTSNLPTIYLSDAYPVSGRIWMYGERLFGANWAYIDPKYTFASNLKLPDINALKFQLDRDIPGLVARVRSNLRYSDEIWYSLILSGAKEIERLDMNNIANILEIPGMIRLFDKIYEKFVSFKDGSKVYTNPTTGKIIKKAACIYLGLHYGIKLTVLDVRDIVQTFKDNPTLLRQFRRRVVSYSSTSIDGNIYNCKVCMKPQSGREITDMRDLCRILGIELSALNLWDLVPWSFVVDWFIPISNILDSFENIARLESTYDLEYLLQSVSRVETVAWKDYRFRIKVYDRYVTDHMPEFGFTIGNPSGLNNHVIEASALIINSVD
mgnify:CR=1 FL=1